MNLSSIWVRFLLITVVMVLANLITQRMYFRLDFTEDKRYTLSQATKDILKDLPSVITVKGYFSKDLQPPYSQVRQDLEDLLIEYSAHSNGRVAYEFTNPNESEESEQEAQQLGVRPFLINIRERDQVKQMRAYMGAMIYAGEKEEAIPFFKSNTSAEYPLTQAIKKLVIEKKPNISLLQGYAEPDWETLGQLQGQLSALYELNTITIDSSTSLSPQIQNTLLWIKPQDTIPPLVFDEIRQYISQGGRLLLAYSQVDANTSGPYPLLNAAPDIGIRDFLSQTGIALQEACLVDARANSVNVQQKQGVFVFNTSMTFPYFPIIESFTDHPIGQGLETVPIQYATATHIASNDSSLQITPLLNTSEQSGIVGLPHPIDLSKSWQSSDFILPNQAIGYALEGNVFGGNEGKIVYIASQDFIVPPSKQQQVDPNGISLIANAIDWLADDTGLVALRNKGVTARPIKELEDTTKTLLKYLNLLAPIFLVLVYGFVRTQLNTRARHKRMG